MSVFIDELFATIRGEVEEQLEYVERRGYLEESAPKTFKQALGPKWTRTFRRNQRRKYLRSGS